MLITVDRCCPKKDNEANNDISDPNFTKSTDSLENFVRNRCENFLMVKGAACYISSMSSLSNDTQSLCEIGNTKLSKIEGHSTGELRNHLKSMYGLIRPTDHIQLAVKLESLLDPILENSSRIRYMILLSNDHEICVDGRIVESHLILGIDGMCDKNIKLENDLDKETSQSRNDVTFHVGLVLPFKPATTRINLDGEGALLIDSLHNDGWTLTESQIQTLGMENNTSKANENSGILDCNNNHILDSKQQNDNSMMRCVRHHHHYFKPVSVQALWTSVQCFHRYLNVNQPRTLTDDKNGTKYDEKSCPNQWTYDGWLKHYASLCLTHTRLSGRDSVALREWHALAPTDESSSSKLFYDLGSKHYHLYYNNNNSSTAQELNPDIMKDDVHGHHLSSTSNAKNDRIDCQLKAIIMDRLRDIMAKVDLEDITFSQIRKLLEVDLESSNLIFSPKNKSVVENDDDIGITFGMKPKKLNVLSHEFKVFIEEQILLIMGQMDKATPITSNLFLGSEWNASNLDELRANRIGYIINVTKEVENFFPTYFCYQNIRVADDESSDLLSQWDKTYKFISRAIKKAQKSLNNSTSMIKNYCGDADEKSQSIHNLSDCENSQLSFNTMNENEKECLETNEKPSNNDVNRSNILVHCKMGISRSASVVIAYIMKSKRMNFEQAFAFVKSKRSCINPNPHFEKQLLTYQGILDASQTRNLIWRSKSESQLKPYYLKKYHQMGPTLCDTLDDDDKIIQNTKDFIMDLENLDVTDSDNIKSKLSARQIKLTQRITKDGSIRRGVCLPKFHSFRQQSYDNGRNSFTLTLPSSVAKDTEKTQSPQIMSIPSRHKHKKSVISPTIGQSEQSLILDDPNLNNNPNLSNPIPRYRNVGMRRVVSFSLPSTTRNSLPSNQGDEEGGFLHRRDSDDSDNLCNSWNKNYNSYTISGYRNHCLRTNFPHTILPPIPSDRSSLSLGRNDSLMGNNSKSSLIDLSDFDRQQYIALRAIFDRNAQHHQNIQSQTTKGVNGPNADEIMVKPKCKSNSSFSYNFIKSKLVFLCHAMLQHHYFKQQIAKKPPPTKKKLIDTHLISGVESISGKRATMKTTPKISSGLVKTKTQKYEKLANGLIDLVNVDNNKNEDGFDSFPASLRPKTWYGSSTINLIESKNKSGLTNNDAGTKNSENERNHIQNTAFPHGFARSRSSLFTSPLYSVKSSPQQNCINKTPDLGIVTSKPPTSPKHRIIQTFKPTCPTDNNKNDVLKCASSNNLILSPSLTPSSTHIRNHMALGSGLVKSTANKFLEANIKTVACTCNKKSEIPSSLYPNSQRTNNNDLFPSSQSATSLSTLSNIEYTQCLAHKNTAKLNHRKNSSNFISSYFRNYDITSKIYAFTTKNNQPFTATPSKKPLEVTVPKTIFDGQDLNNKNMPKDNINNGGDLTCLKRKRGNALKQHQYVLLLNQKDKCTPKPNRTRNTDLAYTFLTPKKDLKINASKLSLSKSLDLNGNKKLNTASKSPSTKKTSTFYETLQPTTLKT